MAAASPPAYALGGAPRVDLMPRTETDRRQRHALVRKWVWAIIAAVSAVALAIAGGAWMQWSAQQRLASANADTTVLLGELAALTDVRTTAALEEELTEFRSQAMASDLAWPSLLGSVASVLPDDVVISGFDLTSGAIPVGEDPAGEVGVIGTMTFATSTPVEIVPLIRSVRALPGVIDADGWELTSEGDPRVYTYLLRTTFDQSVYTGDYANGEEQ
ncbi:hypothetical protein [Microbacterium sp. SSM24]|uniref:hypothetical protein n=1 Tax=Microbacterium sp. SSM24 TaxID=2991714 RepID=UPI002226713B|nr:hypothetical protein [Microbacterium sp. SSM24]MCW3494789.1 hypothetical protein [Microbacterium sp. SSM24]